MGRYYRGVLAMDVLREVFGGKDGKEAVVEYQAEVNRGLRDRKERYLEREREEAEMVKKQAWRE